DKQRLVQLLQDQGQVVAVTGDGTNDAPALNHAHVGLSLGSGTNVAKEASDMTLIDDSFGSIVNAVMWGRSLYRNIQRFLYFQLVVNITALLLVIGGSLIGTEMPLTVTQILWVNIIMDTFAALAISSIPPSCEVMAEKPRRQTDFILSKPIIRGITVTGLLMFAVMFVYLVYCEYGIDLGSADTNGTGVDPHELTRFFTVFVMLQWWNLFNARSIGSRQSSFSGFLKARGFCLVLLMIIAGQWMIVQYGGAMFRCVPLSVSDWIWIILLTSPVLWAGEAYRWAKGHLSPSKG
ncbi:MAG: HAD-IC family P-type ATPase, partial [Prevotella sp.]|nr:HAD-IC family P-type ATPase [Prevotella sp.]